MNTKSQWDTAVDIYNEGMGEDGDVLNNTLIYPVIIKLLGNFKNKTILDSGCGSGYFTAKLAENAKEVIGTDFSESFIKLCKHKYITIPNLTFEQQDITEKMQFKDGSFDFVISKMVLQYVKDLHMFADETLRILRKSGHLLIAVDHPFNTQFYFAQKLAGSMNPKYKSLSHYFDRNEQTKRSLWGKVDLTWYPKTIADYSMPFINKGFYLNTIEELSEEKKGTPIPRVLILDFLKK